MTMAMILILLRTLANGLVDTTNAPPNNIRIHCYDKITGVKQEYNYQFPGYLLTNALPAWLFVGYIRRYLGRF